MCSLISTLSKNYLLNFFFKYFKNYDNIKISSTLRIQNHNSSLLNEYVVLKELKPQIYSNLNRQLPKERLLFWVMILLKQFIVVTKGYIKQSTFPTVFNCLDLLKLRFWHFTFTQ